MHKGWHSRGYLPHFDAGGVVQGITFRLWDSLPAIVEERMRDVCRGQDEAAWRAEREGCLNAGYGRCYLGLPCIAAMMEEVLLHFDGERYRLIAWVVMPNHVHVIAELFDGYSLGAVVHSWKSYSAGKANDYLGRKGPFWYPDYYDRFVRDQSHLGTMARYVHENPVKAGLVERAEDWQYSSARLWLLDR